MGPNRVIGDVSENLNELARDLELGKWERDNSGTLNLKECDFGYRLVVAK